MDSSALIGAGNSCLPTVAKQVPSQCKGIAIALTVILALASVLAVAIGVGGYLKLNPILIQFSQFNSLALITAGSIGVIIAGLIVTLVVAYKTNKNSERIEIENHEEETPLIAPSSKGSLIDISNNTLQLMQQGYYYNSKNERIPFQSGEAMAKNSRLFVYDEQVLTPVEPKHQQKVSVINGDCLDVAQDFARESKVAVINFAGPGSAGGGFLEGTSGQEEVFIYRSDLFALMQYYFDQQTTNIETFDIYPLYKHLIFTPDVTIFRNNVYEALDEPFQVGVLTSAAPVSEKFDRTSPNAFKIRIATDGEVDYASEDTRELMRKIIYTQLKAAYDGGYETIVLGAFGCGAFRNPPQAVAKIFHEVITSYFNGAFKHIVFPILDCRPQEHNPTGNIEPFKKYLHEKTYL